MSCSVLKPLARIFLVLLICSCSSLFAQPNDTLVIGYIADAPFVVETPESINGPSVWLWDHVAEELEQPYVYQKMDLDNLLHRLASGTIDISLSPLTITSDRMEQMDFSAPYFIAHSTLMRMELSSFERFLAFVKSFFSLAFFQVLGGLAFVILMFGFLVWLFERKGNREEFDSSLKGLWSGFWWSAVTMTTVGYGDKSPRTVGGRVVALVWMFAAIIIISGFTASIASSLTINTIGTAGSTVEDFKDRTIGTIHNSGTDVWLTNHFFTNTRTFVEVTEMKQALDEGEIDVIAYDKPILQELIRHDSLESYQLVPTEFNPQFYAMGINRRLPDTLKFLIDLAILEQTESVEWKILLNEYDLE